ncbi:Ger(x)C family spore germination protein [Bacillus thuringiensis]|uniref:Ger(x)C family spore germination protein n=1 Tax=Bacillus thuringiensis TaxID=1428 RepID=UPI001EDE4911|nr:Ger(x)C family spore germination protein [Bacillus thuringiensis]MCG3424353.1 Ger(x)C family spore germination protein [Bacillus thuringiensis]
MRYCNRKKKYFVLCILSLMLTGCWDSRDVEKISLVIATAYDEVEKGEGQEDLLMLTNQILVPQASNGNKSTAQKPYYNVSVTGNSINQMTREFASKVDYPIFGQHLKLVVLSDRVAKRKNIQKVLNLYLRDEELRRSCIVVIAKGRASEVLEAGKNTNIPAERILNISSNGFATTRIIPQIGIGKVSSYFTAGRSFLLQSVETNKKNVKFAGAAVIEGKTKKLLGFLNQKEVDGVSWIKGQGMNGVLTTRDTTTKALVVYGIDTIHSKVTPFVKGDDISFHINITSEGKPSEDWFETGDVLRNEKLLKKIEKSLAQKVEGIVNESIRVAQEEYKVDILGFDDVLRIHFPRVWEKIKENWDQQFSKATVKYNVKINIHDFGTKGSKK